MAENLANSLGKPDSPHNAWRRHYHYLRLERHGQSRSWHGGKGWGRAFLVAVALFGIAAYGFHHRLTSPYAYSPSALTVQAPGAPAAAEPRHLPEAADLPHRP